MADVKPIPEGYHSLTPYLVIDGAGEAMEYYKTAFGAVELFRMEHEGKIGHAEMKIGDSCFMLGDQNEQMGYKGPKANLLFHRLERNKKGQAVIGLPFVLCPF